MIQPKKLLVSYNLLEIPALRLFLGADAQLLGTSLLGATLLVNICLILQIELNIDYLALPGSELT